MQPLKKNLKPVLFFAFVLISAYAMARAGGSGGRSHSSSGDGGGGGLFWLLYLIPFPWNIIVVGAIVVAYYFYNKNAKTKSVLNNIPASGDMLAEGEISSFMAANPEFNLSAFKDKVQLAFTGIQVAWENQNLSKVRKWISDGVYQRFNTQFIMMQMLGQKNTIKNVVVKNVVIDSVESDGDFDIIHTAIQFEMEDSFVCDKYPELNEEGYYEDVEYWTFLRKKGVKEKDIYHTNNCPKCGGNLPEDGGEVSKCGHCGTTTYLGDYDWVLAEITQAADYVNEPKRFDKSGKATQRIREQIEAGSDFSVQNIEDKASNGYLQIMTAFVKQKPEIMRRFVSDALFDKLSRQIKSDPPYVFNRLFLNNVTLMDAYTQDGKNNLVISMKRSAQRISLKDGKVSLLDHSIYATNEVLIMSRDAKVEAPKGSLYSHSCPNCGGPLGDTLNLTCQYCGSAVNSTKYEWIVSDLVSATEYNQMLSNNALPGSVKPGELDELYDVRDYAFNNVMLIVGADGEFAAEEMEYATTLAKKWNYKPEKIHGMFDMAKNGQLVMRLPDNLKKAQKVYAMMEKAAMADGNISREEQLILDDVKERIRFMN
jgi:predicted lipid-binding transport protein (Tim44 family)